MGGSTNTVLHLLAAAHEAGLDFGLADIDAVSRKVPCLTKVAPNGPHLVEDVHRAAGVPALLGELDRAGLLYRDSHSAHARPLRPWPDKRDVRGPSPSADAFGPFHAGPGCERSALASSPSRRWEQPDNNDRTQGRG